MNPRNHRRRRQSGNPNNPGSKWTRASVANTAHGCRQGVRLLRAPSNGLGTTDEFCQPGWPMEMCICGTAIFSSTPKDIQCCESFGHGPGQPFRIQSLVYDSCPVSSHLICQPGALRHDGWNTCANRLSE